MLSTARAPSHQGIFNRFPRCSTGLYFPLSAEFVLPALQHLWETGVTSNKSRLQPNVYLLLGLGGVCPAPLCKSHSFKITPPILPPVGDVSSAERLSVTLAPGEYPRISPRYREI